MPETAVYAPGTPIWVDLAVVDVAKAKTFYKAVLGWDADDVPQSEAGGYGMFKVNGKMVAGYMPVQNEQQPVVWTTYVSVEDAAKTADRVKEAGGTVIAGPMQVMEAGSMALFADPTGGVVGVWQPGQHTGADIYNAPGALTWNELATRDPAKAAAFYSKVFGWEAPADAATAQYVEWKLGGRTIGGMMPMGDTYPASVPPHWLTYFAVADCDRAVAAVAAVGGKVVMPAKDIDQGRMAVIADPGGATFAIIKPKQA
jgi:predicted enzyme related to lactoylglutathione lyase